MQIVSVRNMAFLLVVALVEVTWAIHPSLSRWTRQAIHCQAGDEACKMCSTSCNSVDESRLPECCEAYNACCDQYFQACKKCSSVAAKDQYFPEYCCASFTDCCHLITTFQTSVTIPEPVRKEPKTDLKIPSVAAPKPTTFPGTLSTTSVTSPSHTQPDPQAPLTSQTTSLSSQFPPLRASQDQASSRVVVGSQRTQSSTRSQQRSQQRSPPVTRSRRPQVSSDSQRRGRVTSRGRLIQ